MERLLLQIPEQYFTIVLTNMFRSNQDLPQAYNNWTRSKCKLGTSYTNGELFILSLYKSKLALRC